MAIVCAIVLATCPVLIHLVRGRNKQQTVVNEAMNLEFHKMQYCSLRNCQLLKDCCMQAVTLASDNVTFRKKLFATKLETVVLSRFIA